MTPRAAAEQLLATLHGFSEQRSNPVLSVIGEARQLVAERKYPDPALVFGAGDWRAYYHFHDTEQANEHGHFHVFTRAGEDAVEWAHVAALGMDAQGQPLRWFAVNAWVSRDAWLPSGSLADALIELGAAADDELLAAWLASMLGLYADELAALWQQRDEAVARAANGRALAEVLQDRALYELGARPIDLQSRLESVLL